MARLPYMKWYTGDWIRDTRGLSYAARGFWKDCLAMMHSSGTFEISGTIESLARKTSGLPSEVETIIIELEREKVCDIKNDNGLVTLLSRRLQREVNDRNINKLRQDRYRCNASVTQEVTDLSQMERSPHMGMGMVSGNGSGIEDEEKEGMGEKGFGQFWASYPRRAGKGAARNSWEKAVRKSSPEIIMAGLDRYRQKITAEKTDEKYIAHPATWLNQERWADEAAPEVKKESREERMEKIKKEYLDSGKPIEFVRSLMKERYEYEF